MPIDTTCPKCGKSLTNHNLAKCLRIQNRKRNTFRKKAKNKALTDFAPEPKTQGKASVILGNRYGRGKKDTKPERNLKLEYYG